MLRSSGTLKSRSDSRRQNLWSRGVRDFLAALCMLGIALYLALLSESAVRRGESALGVVFSTAALLLAAATAVIFVPRIAARVNFRRWRLPVSFSITREGGIFILSIFLLSLAAINSGNNLLFMILAALLSAIITSGIFARASLWSVSVSMDVPENVFVGERVSIRVSLRNRKRLLPSVSISVEDLGLMSATDAPPRGRRSALISRFAKSVLPAGDKSVLRHSAYFPLIPSGETRTELVSQSFPARGRYRLEGFRISTRFPFGLFKRGERVKADGEVLVYPSIQEISSYFHLLPFQPGRLEGRRTGPGETLYAIRRYFEGDSARQVDWKATAKTGELMARQYAREEESKFCLILDTSASKAPDADVTARFEKAVSLAASLAAHFSEEGAEVEYLSPGEYIPRGLGRDHLYRILRSLAIVAQNADTNLFYADLREELAGVISKDVLEDLLSEKVFKIIITPRARGSFPSAIWRSSHVVYFDEL